MALTGDRTNYNNAVRQLHWATYMIDTAGRNLYPNDIIWLTDGYGDYVRHYLRAMAAMSELSPSNEEHILSSTSVIQEADYAPFGDFWFGDDLGNIDRNHVKVFYRAFDNTGVEKIRLLKKPSGVIVGRSELHELNE